MKKILSILIINLMLFSCNGQNNKEINNNMKQAPYNISEEGEGLKFNYDSLSSKLIEHGKKSLKNMNFKFPSNQVFHEKIKDYSPACQDVFRTTWSVFNFFAQASNRHVHSTYISKIIISPNSLK